MDRANKPNDLDSHFDETFQQRWWRAERIAWGALVVILLAGLSGAFGRGSLSKATARGGALTIEYERLARYKTPTPFTVDAAAPGDEVVLFVGQALLSTAKLSDVVPTPTEMRAGGDGVRLVFRKQQGATSVRAQMTFEPQRAGVVKGRVGLDGGEQLEVRQLIFP
jgi:hypothetical protein